MLVRLCLVQDSSSLKKLPLSARLSRLSVLPRNLLDRVVGVEELPLGAVGASLARLHHLNEADFEGSVVSRVATSADNDSSSRGSSP